MGCWGITALESDNGLDAVRCVRYNLPADGQLDLGEMLERLKKDRWNAPCDVKLGCAHTSPMALAEIVVKYLDGDPGSLDYTNKIVDMFAADRTVSVELLCENKLMKTIIDHYGEAVPTRTYDEEHFTANIEVDPSGTFYGWVFKFMGGIQIIAPHECVEEMKRIAHRFL